MSTAYPLRSAPADLIIELTDPPVNFQALLEILHDRRFNGQILVNFRYGLPRTIAIPRLETIPLARSEEGPTPPPA